MPKLTLEESLAKNGFLTYRIRDEDILGVLTSFQHNGHTVSVSDWGYRLYSRGWVFFSASAHLLQACERKTAPMKQKHTLQWLSAVTVRALNDCFAVFAVNVQDVLFSAQRPCF